MSVSVAQQLDDIEQRVALLEDPALVISYPPHLSFLGQGAAHSGRRYGEINLAVATRALDVVNAVLEQKDRHYYIRTVFYYYFQNLGIPIEDIRDQFKKSFSSRDVMIDALKIAADIANRHLTLAYDHVDFSPELRNEWAQELELVLSQKKELAAQSDAKFDRQEHSQFPEMPNVEGNPRRCLTSAYNQAAVNAQNTCLMVVNLLDAMLARHVFMKGAAMSVPATEFVGTKTEIANTLNMARVFHHIGAECQAFAERHLDCF